MCCCIFLPFLEMHRCMPQSHPPANYWIVIKLALCAGNGAYATKDKVV